MEQTKRINETAIGERFTFEDDTTRSGRHMARYGECERVSCPERVDYGGLWFRVVKTGRTHLAASGLMQVRPA